MAWPTITDDHRNKLLREPKPVVANRWSHCVWRGSGSRAGNRTSRLRVSGDHGSRFHVSWRQSLRSPENFCIVLRYYVAKKATVNLIRCDGCHTEHTNVIERDAKLPNAVVPANTPHLHIITERYQLAAVRSPRSRADDYAEPMDQHYLTFEEAFRFFWDAFKFYQDHEEGRADRLQLSLFPLNFTIDTFHA